MDSSSIVTRLRSKRGERCMTESPVSKSEMESIYGTPSKRVSTSSVKKQNELLNSASKPETPRRITRRNSLTVESPAVVSTPMKLARGRSLAIIDEINDLNINITQNTGMIRQCYVLIKKSLKINDKVDCVTKNERDDNKNKNLAGRSQTSNLKSPSSVIDSSKQHKVGTPRTEKKIKKNETKESTESLNESVSNSIKMINENDNNKNLGEKSQTTNLKSPSSVIDSSNEQQLATPKRVNKNKGRKTKKNETEESTEALNECDSNFIKKNSENDDNKNKNLAERSQSSKLNTPSVTDCSNENQLGTPKKGTAKNKGRKAKKNESEEALNESESNFIKKNSEKDDNKNKIYGEGSQTSNLESPSSVIDSSNEQELTTPKRLNKNKGRKTKKTETEESTEALNESDFNSTKNNSQNDNNKNKNLAERSQSSNLNTSVTDSSNENQLDTPKNGIKNESIKLKKKETKKALNESESNFVKSNSQKDDNKNKILAESSQTSYLKSPSSVIDSSNENQLDTPKKKSTNKGRKQKKNDIDESTEALNESDSSLIQKDNSVDNINSIHTKADSLATTPKRNKSNSNNSLLEENDLSIIKESINNKTLLNNTSADQKNNSKNFIKIADKETSHDISSGSKSSNQSKEHKITFDENLIENDKSPIKYVKTPFLSKTKSILELEDNISEINEDSNNSIEVVRKRSINFNISSASENKNSDDEKDRIDELIFNKISPLKMVKRKTSLPTSTPMNEIKLIDRSEDRSKSADSKKDKSQKQKLFSWSNSTYGKSSDKLDVFGEKEKKIETPIKSSPKIKSKLYISSDESEEEDDNAEEKEKNEFIEDEALVGDDDSMDAGERQYMEENEIPMDGVSLGSQDSNEYVSDNEYEKDSFVVSDEEAVLLSDTEDDLEESKKDRKYKRILTTASDSDEENVKLTDYKRHSIYVANINKSRSDSLDNLAENANITMLCQDNDEYDPFNASKVNNDKNDNTNFIDPNNLTVIEEMDSENVDPLSNSRCSIKEKNAADNTNISNNNLSVTLSSSEKGETLKEKISKEENELITVSSNKNETLQKIDMDNTEWETIMETSEIFTNNNDKQIFNDLSSTIAVNKSRVKQIVKSFCDNTSSDSEKNCSQNINLSHDQIEKVKRVKNASLEVATDPSSPDSEGSIKNDEISKVNDHSKNIEQPKILDSESMENILSRCTEILEMAKHEKIKAKSEAKKMEQPKNKKPKKKSKNNLSEKLGISGNKNSFKIISSEIVNNPSKKKSKLLPIDILNAISSTDNISKIKENDNQVASNKIKINKKRKFSDANISDAESIVQGKKMKLNNKEVQKVAKEKILSNAIKGKKNNNDNKNSNECGTAVGSNSKGKYLQSCSGLFYEEPIIAEKNEKRNIISKFKTKSGIVIEEPLTPTSKRTQNGFIETPLTPLPIGYKVRRILSAGQQEPPIISKLSDKKSRNKIKINEPNFNLPKPIWTQSGIFYEEKLSLPSIPIKSKELCSTEFAVCSLDSKKPKYGYDFNLRAKKFKENALRKNKAVRESSKDLLRRKARQNILKKF